MFCTPTLHRSRPRTFRKRRGEVRLVGNGRPLRAGRIKSGEIFPTLRFLEGQPAMGQVAVQDLRTRWGWGRVGIGCGHQMSCGPYLGTHTDSTGLGLSRSGSPAPLNERTSSVFRQRTISVRSAENSQSLLCEARKARPPVSSCGPPWTSRSAHLSNAYLLNGGSLSFGSARSTPTSRRRRWKKSP